MNPSTRAINPARVIEDPVSVQGLPEKHRWFFEMFEVPITPDVKRYKKTNRKVEPTGRRKSNLYARAYAGSKDAEWVVESPGSEKNRVLSVQIATVSREKANNVIAFLEGGKRPRFSEWIEAGIRSVHGGTLPVARRGEPFLFVLACHNGLAELSVLEDRDAPYIKNC